MEVHTVDVFVETDGEHQDEFMRGDRPKALFRGSIATPSLVASILYVKYVNSAPLHRIGQEFSRNGVHISRQTMSNRMVGSASRYFTPLVERMKQELLKLPGLTNANCRAHARRDHADAIKITDKSNPDAVRRSVAYQALSRISQIYKPEGALKELSAEERLRERQNTIKPLAEEYFAWVKAQLENTTVPPPKEKTAEGLKYSIKQGKYLKVFLTDGNVPIDNSASERAIRISMTETNLRKKKLNGYGSRRTISIIKSY